MASELAKPKRIPLFTFVVSSHDRRRTVYFEPLGEGYDLEPGDYVTVHVFGQSVGLDERPDYGDLVFDAAEDHIWLHLNSLDYAVWNKAGTKLKV